MSHRSAVGVVAALLLLGVASPPPAAAQAVTVIVDGRGVPFDQPPVVTGGRVLIPLRGVFERLGATVDWDPFQRQVIARRGGTTILLRPGDPIASVDGDSVRLDVPAIIVGGRTMIPLRFVAEALGAGVDWEPVGRVVYVRSARRAPPGAERPPALPRPIPLPSQPTPTPPPAPEPPRPLPVIPPPPTPAPTYAAEGTVARVDAHTVPQRLHLWVDAGLASFNVTAATTVFVFEAATGRGGSAGLAQVHRGDHAQVSADRFGNALTVRATYKESEGRLQGLAMQLLYLLDGQVLRLGAEPLFILDGREVTRDLMRQGLEVSLRLNPRTGEVWEVVARSAGLPPPPPPPRPAPTPGIESASINSAGPLGIGQQLVVTMRGTPGGSAWFEIGRMGTRISMVEGPPGRYVGRHTVRAEEEFDRVPVTVHLRAGRIDTERHAGRVTLDGIVPEFAYSSPPHGSQTREDQPAISIRYVDRGPAGIDRNSVRMWVNGEEVGRLSVGDTEARYTPREPLSPGLVRVNVRVADLAGNEATAGWAFRIERPAPPPPPPPPSPRPTPSVTPTPADTPRPPGLQPPSPPPGLQPPSPPPGLQIAPPVILSPKPGDEIERTLTIRGTAAEARVVVTVELRERGPGAEPEVFGPALVSVTAKGEWEVRIRLPRLPRAGTLTITAVALRGSAERSAPAQTIIRWPSRD